MISKPILTKESLKEPKEQIVEEIDFRQSTAQAQSIELEIKRYSWPDFREDVNVFCNLSFRIFSICCGVLQFFATMAGFEHIFPNHNIIPVAASFLLAFFPGVGTVFGIWGAHIAWGWYLSQAIAIFIIPYSIVILPMNFIAIVEFFKDIHRWHAENRLLENSES